MAHRNTAEVPLGVHPCSVYHLVFCKAQLICCLMLWPTFPVLFSKFLLWLYSTRVEVGIWQAVLPGLLQKQAWISVWLSVGLVLVMVGFVLKNRCSLGARMLEQSPPVVQHPCVTCGKLVQWALPMLWAPVTWVIWSGAREDPWRNLCPGNLNGKHSSEMKTFKYCLFFLLHGDQNWSIWFIHKYMYWKLGMMVVWISK